MKILNKVSLFWFRYIKVMKNNNIHAQYKLNIKISICGNLVQLSSIYKEENKCL